MTLPGLADGCVSGWRQRWLRDAKVGLQFLNCFSSKGAGDSVIGPCLRVFGKGGDVVTSPSSRFRLKVKCLQLDCSLHDGGSS